VAPSASDDSSTRISDRRFTRLPPFFSFSMNVGLNRSLAESKADQLRKPPSEFATSEHMTLFGRPLWRAYKDELCRTMRAIALQKVFGGEFDASNTNHIFAAMSYRVCLQPCVSNREVVELSRKAVNSHLRVILQLDSDNGLLRTTAPSEPVVCEALAYLLNPRHGDSPRHEDSNLWDASLRTLVNKLLSPGLIDKGRTGEMAMRIILIIARDQMLATSFSDVDYGFARMFTLVSFLQALLVEDMCKIIKTSRARPPKMQSETAQTVEQALGSAHLNFTLFFSTEASLKPESMPDLLHGLMLHQAALQIKSNGEDWDLVIPLYLGDLDEPFNRSHLTAFLFRVKNRITPKPWIISESKYTGLLPGVPILAVVVELGLKEPGCSQLESSNDDIFLFKITGHGKSTYKFLDDPLELTMKLLLGVKYDSATEFEMSIATRTDPFKFSHWWKDCYPGFSAAPNKTEDAVALDEHGDQGPSAPKRLKTGPTTSSTTQASHPDQDIRAVRRGPRRGSGRGRNRKR
jgi:hypothetical protein